MSSVDVYAHPGEIPAVEWHVVFCPSVSNLRHLLPWPMRVASAWTDPRFRHCFALRPAELGSMMLNCVGQQIVVDWMPWEPRVVAAGCAGQGWRVLRVPAMGWAGYRLRGVLSCVSVVKAALGLRGGGILTPRQLYRRLLREGAYIVTGG